MSSAIVLLSGGLDSTVCLALAARECEQVIAVSVDYGQQHSVELERARAIVHPLLGHGLEHLIVRLNAADWGGSALTDPSIQVPQSGEVTPGVIPVTYVPARNLMMLSIAASIAEAREAEAIYIGVNALDYSGYPDCRPEFIRSFQATLDLALKRAVLGNPLEIRTPLIDMSKADIAKLGQRLHARIDLSWSCYLGGDAPCGRCDACVLRARGYAEAGLTDPALVPRVDCPCCHNLTLQAHGGFEMCPVCGWEDDGQDDGDAEVVRNSANEALSLAVARENFSLIGACSEQLLSTVRPPLRSECTPRAAAATTA